MAEGAVDERGAGGGNVGINTATPTAQLTLQKAVACRHMWQWLMLEDTGNGLRHEERDRLVQHHIQLDARVASR